MQSFLAILCFGNVALGTGDVALTCGPLPNNQLYRDEVFSTTECGNECGTMCFQSVVEGNIYLAGNFDTVVGVNSSVFLEECGSSFVEAGHDVSCKGVLDVGKGSIKVVVRGPEDEVLDARYSTRDNGMNLQSFQALSMQPFDAINCQSFPGIEMTCWADTAYSECSDGAGGAQNAYNLIMEETDVRVQYKLREGCGTLVLEQCLADSTSSAFQGAACSEVLRTTICVGNTDKFRTCAGQKQCGCPAEGEDGYAEGAVWGLSSNCSSTLCMAGCAADGQSFTGGALTSTQLSTLASKANNGETQLDQTMNMLARPYTPVCLPALCVCLPPLCIFRTSVLSTRCYFRCIVC